MRQNSAVNMKISVDLAAGQILNFNRFQSNKSLHDKNFSSKYSQQKYKRKNNIVKSEQIQRQSNPKINYLKSEADRFLFSQGAQTEALDDIQFNSPEIFQLSAYHIGTSILRFKEAGLSENIFSAGMRHVFQELNLYYLIIPKYSILLVQFMNLLREFVGVDTDCAFRIFTRIFLFGRKFQRTESWKFLDSQIDNSKLVLQVLKNHLTKPQIFEVVSSNPDILCAESKQLNEIKKMYFSLRDQIEEENKEGIRERELSEKFLQLLVITDFF